MVNKNDNFRGIKRHKYKVISFIGSIMSSAAVLGFWNDNIFNFLRSFPLKSIFLWIEYYAVRKYVFQSSTWGEQGEHMNYSFHN